MAKQNRNVKTRVRGPVQTSQAADSRTYEGAEAYSRDALSELFLLGIRYMVGEDTFYEGASSRDDRFERLVRQVAVEDREWLVNFLDWLRNEANMRSAPAVGAAIAVHALSKAGVDGGREVVRRSLARADEPGEVLAYWLKNYGKPLPKSLKKGLYDAAKALYNEYSLLKYDTKEASVRFGDVIEFTQGPDAGPLWQYAIDRRHDNVDGLQGLDMVDKRILLGQIPVAERRGRMRELFESGEMETAGITWEALSGWLEGPMDAEAWEMVIPQMGYMALLRNLNNFDRAGVSDAVAARVCSVLSDPMRVATSRQFPYRFLSAYKAIDNDRWKVALGKAFQLSVKNIPALPGRSLVLVDTSGSMQNHLTVPDHNRKGARKHSPFMIVEAAALFGIATAYAQGIENVDLFGFAGDNWGSGRRSTFEHKLPKGGSMLKQIGKFCDRVGEVGHGTDIEGALNEWSGHDRVFLFTDGQSASNIRGSKAVRSGVPIYAFDLGGYAKTPFRSSGRVVELGGLSDATFKLIPALEDGKNARWPWLR